MWRTLPGSVAPGVGRVAALARQLGRRRPSTCAAGSNTVRFAGSPGRDRAAVAVASRPAMRAGCHDSSATHLAAGRGRARRVAQRPSAVSSPSMPGRRLLERLLLGLRRVRARGRWRWRRSCRRPGRRLSAATSASVRSGGFILYTGSKPAQQLVGEREVVRRSLGGHRQALGLGRAHQLDAAAPSTGAARGPATGERGRARCRGPRSAPRRRRPARDAEARPARPLVHDGALGEARDLAVLGEHRRRGPCAYSSARRITAGPARRRRRR